MTSLKEFRSLCLVVIVIVVVVVLLLFLFLDLRTLRISLRVLGVSKDGRASCNISQEP